MSTIDKQDLANYLVGIQDSDQGGDIKQAMVHDFGLPEPLIEQTMVITLHIPVTNPDTDPSAAYTTARHLLLEILVKRGDDGIRKLLDLIETVHIQPRS